MHGPAVADGRRRRKSYLIGFLDDATRVCPFAALAPAENTVAFLPVFKQALIRRGIPQRLYVDNGSELAVAVGSGARCLGRFAVGRPRPVLVFLQVRPGPAAPLSPRRWPIASSPLCVTIAPRLIAPPAPHCACACESPPNRSRRLRR